MKLIIDIPDEDYEFIKDLQSLMIGSRSNCKTIQKNVINAIKKANFRSIGILEGVSDAAKFYTLNIGGGVQTAYQKTNGDIYILTIGMRNVDGLADETYYGVMQ